MTTSSAAAEIEISVVAPLFKEESSQQKKNHHSSSSTGKNGTQDTTPRMVENEPSRNSNNQHEESLLTRLYLAANFAFQVPFYSICVCLAVYVALLVWAARGNHPWLLTVVALYVPYCTLGLDSSPRTGITWLSYPTIEWFRSRSCFRDAARYLRARVIKTHELDPQYAYILAYHPHGIISMGANTALSTNGCDFPSLFPGIRRWGVTLHQIFLIPFYREWLLINGFLVADKKTLESKLRAGDSLVLIPGGAVEALYAASDRFVLYLSNRKGFIKLAMETGAGIVPCIGFGENDVFHTYVPEHHHGTFAIILQKILLGIRKYTRFSTPIMTWPIPKRPQVTIVVGKPMFFDKDESSSNSVEENHQQYVKALRALYEEHKANWGHSSTPLEII